MKHKWKVVPLCEDQLLDIQPEDVIDDGLFRTCQVYKSGGGYDKFPDILYRRTGRKTNPRQFVVQLYGCHLDCFYCYVTPNGVWGKYIERTSEELADAFVRTGLDVFHLMGGSPALYIEYWPELIDRLEGRGDFVFHSDLLLTEKRYNRPLLRAISQRNCLYAVNIKGVSKEDYKRNTGKDFNSTMFWLNLYDLIVCDVPMYLTFTNPDKEKYEEFCEHVEDVFGKEVLKDSFIIDLKDYDATKAYKEKENNDE